MTSTRWAILNTAVGVGTFIAASRHAWELFWIGIIIECFCIVGAAVGPIRDKYGRKW